MENRIVGRRILIAVLGLVIIGGAVLAAVTFNGGNWFASNPAFNQPSNETVDQNNVVPVTGPGTEKGSYDSQYLDSEYGCGHEVVEDPRDW